MLKSRATQATAAALLASGMLIPLEGYSPPYYDSAGVLTDCYGNTKNVDLNNPRSLSECDKLLDDETYRIAYKFQPELGEVSTQTLAAFTSFIYNVGDNAFGKSTALRLWKQGHHVAACEQMYRWVYVTVAGVKIQLRGLHNRRQVEVRQCLAGLD